MMSRYMIGAFDEQRAQIDIFGLGDAELRIPSVQPDQRSGRPNPDRDREFFQNAV
jgi:hypothetical protein